MAVRRFSQFPVSSAEVRAWSLRMPIAWRPVGGRPQRAAQPFHVANAQELLDRLGPRRRGAEAGVLHRQAQLLVLDLLAGGLHVAEQRCLGVARRRLGLLLEHVGRLAGALLALVDLREHLAGFVLVALRLLLQRDDLPVPGRDVVELEQRRHCGR